ncbi:hypothetical protein [Bosea vaviloviae]|uniref:hypothetical protein n=1 Tax=Bosea vaviloviae TaxID=1526658 RepID=UPI000B08C722|nr:hypothetical protein [Bosea vaviloviae]
MISSNRLRAVSLCLALSVAVTSAQAEGFDASQMPKDGSLYIRRIEDLPSDLSKLWIPCTGAALRVDRPIELHRVPKGPVMALVPCSTIVGTTTVWLMRGWPLHPPTRLSLPAPDHLPAGGITMTEDLGIVSWHPADGILLSTMTSDMCPDLFWRSTYQITSYAGFKFSLLRIESGLRACGTTLGSVRWQTEWAANPWRVLPKPTP